jgi:hypothetical protein
MKKILNQFINIKTLETIEKHNPTILQEIFNIHDSELLMKSIKLPNKYFTTSVFDQYTVLPKDANIIKTFK